VVSSGYYPGICLPGRVLVDDRSWMKPEAAPRFTRTHPEAVVAFMIR